MLHPSDYQNFPQMGTIYWQSSRGTGVLIHIGENILNGTLWRGICRNSKLHLPVDSTIPIVRISPKDVLTKIFILGVIYYSTVCNSTKFYNLNIPQ